MGSQYNPMKSYEAASWIDYVEWLDRLGYTEVTYLRDRGIDATDQDGKTYRWETKKQVYMHLLGEGYDADA